MVYRDSGVLWELTNSPDTQVLSLEVEPPSAAASLMAENQQRTEICNKEYSEEKKNILEKK